MRPSAKGGYSKLLWASHPLGGQEPIFAVRQPSFAALGIATSNLAFVREASSQILNASDNDYYVKYLTDLSDRMGFSVKYGSRP